MNKKKIDIVALGELLIDFTQMGESPLGNPVFEANSGGAPCNVLSMLNRLGHEAAFIGKVGKDVFGNMLVEKLKSVGIDTQNLMFDDVVKTTLVLVSTLANGDREFSFYRSPGADMMLHDGDVKEALIASSRIFHFGTLSMTDEPVNSATLCALEYAKKHGCLISFDPNLRASLWNSLALAKQKFELGMRYCDVLKIADNEIQWFTGEMDFNKGVAKIREKFEIPLILVTMGKEGSRVYYGDTVMERKGFQLAETIETTGAGDTFLGCVLHFILNNGIIGLTETQLIEMLDFANAAAALITTKKGALSVMPYPEEIEQLVQTLPEYAKNRKKQKS